MRSGREAVRRGWKKVFIVFLLLTMFAIAGCGGTDDSPDNNNGGGSGISSYTGNYTINSGPDKGQGGTITVQPTGLSANNTATITIHDSAGSIIFMSANGYISPGQNGLVYFGITSAPGASGTPFTVNGGGNSSGSLAGPGTFTTGSGDSAGFSLSKS
jgi:hypothetical protein